MIFFPTDTQLIISNYSSTEIEIKSFFGDLRYLLSKDALVATKADEYTVNIASALDSMNIIDWTIIANNVTSPTFSSIDELINIINGWANSSHEISVNGANSVGMLNTLNFIEGANITITTNYDPTNNVTDVQIDASGGGSGVTAVTGTSPIFSSGGTTPDISIQQSSISQAGYLSSTDWNTFNNKVSSVTATSVLTSSGGDNPNISSQVNKAKLLGRNSVTAGIMEEITVGSGLALSGTTLSNSLPFNTPLTTKGDIYTHDATADARLPVGLDTQMLVADSSTTTGLKWEAQPAATPTGYYAMYQDVLTQNIAVINTGYPIKFRTLDLSNGVTVVSDSRITFANTGIYNLQFSVQLENSDTQEHDVNIWLRLNGVDVPGSTGFVGVVSKHGGINGHALPSWNYLLSVVAGQYYELVWSATSTQVTMPFIAAGSPPSTASAIFTVTQQAGIMAGTGITAINSLTGSAQTLVAGTSGTDFAVSSSGTAHTLNLPTASETNRGALSSTDWTTFNGRQVSPWTYRLSGKWWTPSNNALAIGSLGNVVNSIRFSPVIIDRDITITQLGIAVVTIAGAGNTARVGIYSNNASTNQPQTRLVDSGTLAVDSTGTKTATGLSVSLTKGLYWFAYFTNASTGTVASIANLNLPDVIGVGASLQLGIITGYSQSLTYTNLPATASGFSNILSGASSYCVYYYY